MSLSFAPSHFNRTAISAQVNDLACPICGFAFKNQLSLKAHNKKKQGKCKPRTKKRFFCELCPSGFVKKSDLRVHENKYHGSQEIHLKIVIKGMKAADPGFDECQFLKDVFVAYSSIQQIAGSLASSSSVSPRCGSSANTLPTISNRKKTPFMINDILN